MVKQLDLPGLHKTAGDLSDNYQSRYLWLIRGEYSALFAAAVLALDFGTTEAYRLLYATVLAFGLVLLLIRSTTKPEQSWYRARAIAESVKTSAWRYAMVAHPYNDDNCRKAFLTLLGEILTSNEILSDAGESRYVGSSQITSSMEAVRSFSLSKRMEFYLENRINDQLLWYKKKARANRRAFRYWIFASFLAYASAIILALSRIAYPYWKVVPVEPCIVLASSFIGWIQLKRHSELAASYALTASEIGLAAEDARYITDEMQFSAFVNDAELAFSREHTQWVARQQTSG